MSCEELAAKRVALQTALGSRARRLQDAQYDALIAAQYDTPEALLDATAGNLKEVLKPAFGAVDAVLAWQKETKQGAGAPIRSAVAAAGSSSTGPSRASNGTADLDDLVRQLLPRLKTLLAKDAAERSGSGQSSARRRHVKQKFRHTLTTIQESSSGGVSCDSITAI